MKKLIALCLVLICTLGTALSERPDLQTIMDSADQYESLGGFISSNLVDIWSTLGKFCVNEINEKEWSEKDDTYFRTINTAYGSLVQCIPYDGIRIESVVIYAICDDAESAVNQMLSIGQAYNDLAVFSATDPMKFSDFYTFDEFKNSITLGEKQDYGINVSTVDYMFDAEYSNADPLRVGTIMVAE